MECIIYTFQWQFGKCCVILLWHSAVTSGIQNENRPKHTAIEFTERIVIQSVALKFVGFFVFFHIFSSSNGVDYIVI